MTKYVNVASGEELEADEAHYPWVAEERLERVRARADQHIAERLETAKASKPKASKAKAKEDDDA